MLGSNRLLAVTKQRRQFAPEIYYSGRSLSDVQIRPSGDRVSFVTSGKTRAELSLANADGIGAEVWLPLDPGVMPGEASHGWLTDDLLVYLSVDATVCLFDLHEMTTVCCVDAGDSPGALAVSHDGSTISWMSDMRAIHVYGVDRGRLHKRACLATADFMIDPTLNADGSAVAWHEWDDPHMPWDSSRIATLELGAGGNVTEKRIVAGGDGVGVAQPRFSPDGRYLAYLSDESGWLNLWLRETTAFDYAIPLFGERIDHGDPTWYAGQRTYCWSSDGTHVFLRRNVNGIGKLVCIDVDSGNVEPVDDGWYTSLSARHDVCGLVADDTHDSHLKNASRQTVLAWGGLSGVAESKNSHEEVTWESTDGVTIPGRLYRCTGETLAPLVIWIHGGPAGQSPATYFPRWQYLLDRGWNVLVPDYRGSTGHGRAFREALRFAWGVVDTQDILTAVRAAKQSKWGDPNRIVLWGNSAGGFTALNVLRDDNHGCAAAMLAYPVSELMVEPGDIWRLEAHYFSSLVGDMNDDRDRYIDRSPVNFAHEIDVPLLLLHGDEDATVPSAHSDKLVEALRACGGTVEYHVYEGESHGWRQTATKVNELERVAQFLERHVPGVQHADVTEYLNTRGIDMIWWCRGCGMEETQLRDRCTACGAALQSAELEWLNEGDEGEETVFELDLEPLERVGVIESLVGASIRHRWESDDELVVADRQADAVDVILDDLLGEETRDNATGSGGVSFVDDFDVNADDGFDEFEDGPDVSSGGYEVLSQLFLATDRLRSSQDEDDVKSFLEVSGEVLMMAPPFGIDEETWADVQSATRNISAFLNRDDEDPALEGEIVGLRNQLQQLV